MTNRNRSSCSRYVGRVGILAVTLGVGVAVTPTATQPLQAAPVPALSAASVAVNTPVPTGRPAAVNIGPVLVLTSSRHAPAGVAPTAHPVAARTVELLVLEQPTSVCPSPANVPYQSRFPRIFEW